MKRYNLKFWRMRRDLTQGQVATKLGVSREYYKAVENGRYDPSQKLVNKFADSFAIGPDKLKELFNKEDNGTN